MRLLNLVSFSLRLLKNFLLTKKNCDKGHLQSDRVRNGKEEAIRTQENCGYGKEFYAIHNSMNSKTRV